MADTLLARVAVVVRPANQPRTRDRWQWYEIRIGKGRRVVCQCRGALIDAPKQIDQTLPFSACVHITALYGGQITSDPKEAKLSWYTNSYGGRAPLKFYGILTHPGELMFHHRWAAQALIRD